MKFRIGGEKTPAAEVERARVMREAVGDGVDIMVDINQGWDVNQAITIGRRLEEYGLYWLEDPTDHHDYPGLARIADALTTPIAAGEYHYGLAPFRHMLEHRSIDIVMIDLLRAGGITQWMKAAHMAEAFNLPVVSHLGAGDHGPHDGGDPERADGGEHAVERGAVPGGPGHRERGDHPVGQAGAGARVGPGGAGRVCGVGGPPSGARGVPRPDEGSGSGDAPGPRPCPGFPLSRERRLGECGPSGCGRLFWHSICSWRGTL